MLNTIAVILQHPLVVFAFLYWGVTSPFTHDWQQSHEAFRAMFVKMDFMHVGSETKSLDDSSDIPLTTTMSMEDFEEFTTTEPPFEVDEFGDTTPPLEAEAFTIAHVEEEFTTEAPVEFEEFTTEPPVEFEEFTTEPPVGTELQQRLERNYQVNYLRPRIEHQYKHHGHHHRHEHGRHCRDAADHLGKWSRGCPHQKLHYVCKSNRAVWCDTYGWKRFGDSCYHAELHKVLPYRDAILACRKNRYVTQLLDADLVTIKSAAENQFVQRLVSAQTVWIGLSTTNGTWSWTDGSALKSDSSYVNWDNQSSAHTGAKVQAAFMNDWKVLCMPPPWMQWRVCPKMLIAALVATVFLSCLCSLLVKLIYMCTYKSTVTDKRLPFATQAQQAQHAPDFHHGPFGCLQDMDICIHSCCCSSIRAADTHKGAGISEFWTVIGIWVFSAIAGAILGAGFGASNLVSGLILSGIMTHKRQMLKARLGIAPGSCCADFLLWWCCTPCAVAQEARHVDEATGVKVRCCCSLLQQRSPVVHPMVGSAISLQAVPDAPPQALPVYNQHPAAPPNNMVMSSQSPVHVITAQVVHIQPPSAVAPAVGPAFQMQPVV